MDINSAMKSFIVAANQENVNPSEQNLIQLQRNLDILIGLTTTIADVDHLDSQSVIVTEFTTTLLNIALNTDLKIGLIQRILTLLQNCIQSPKLKEFLQSKFSVYSVIAILLQNNEHIDTVLIPCLVLLSTMTYNLKIAQINNQMEQLIQLLINHIESEIPDIETLCLSTLNNLCRRNSSIRLFIKNVSTSKKLYKILIDKLNHPCLYNVVNSLSILANLILDNEIGEKLFSTKNINKTFQLIFNLAVSEDILAKQAAFDLLMDLLESSNMLKKFVNYKYLIPSLEKIIYNWLKNDTSDNTLLIFKLFLGFISVPSLKSQISLLLFPINTENKESDFTLKLISWVDNSTEMEISILAIRLLIEIIKEQVIKGQNFALELLKIKFDYIIKNIHQMPVIKKEFEKQTYLFDLLIEICKMAQYKKYIASLISINNLELIIINQLQTNQLCIGEDPNECSEIGIDLILNIFSFLQDLKNEINATELINKIIENANITSLISYVIGTEDPKRIYQVMKLAFISEVLCELLSKTIAINNNAHHLSVQKEEKSFKSNYDLERDTKNSLLEERTIDDIEEVIKKIQNGLTFKDLKSSEIIDIYDYKIDVLITKNKQLQEIIDIKTAALHQTDQLLNQFNCQQIQHEAETFKLRNLLKQLKYQNENLEEKIKQFDQLQKSLTFDLESSQQNIKKLQKELEEQLEITSELTQTVNNKQQSLENLHVEYNNVLEMNAILQRHSETMKQKQDLLNEQILELNSEKKNLNKQLKERESSLKELKETIKKLEENLQQKEKNYEMLLIENNSKTQQIEKIQLNNSKLEEKLNNMEIHCQQQEVTIKDGNAQIRCLTEQLERHKQITEMIHNLSSVPVTSPSSS